MKIALISPSFPPDKCGVADHSVKLMKSISAQGFQCNRFQDFTEVPVDQNYSAAIIQYTPNLWPTLGRPFDLTLPVRIARFKSKAKIPVFVIVHELYYPLLLSAKGAVLSILQRAEFIGLKAMSDWTFFTYREPAEFFTTRSSVLPVGSTIDVQSSLPVHKQENSAQSQTPSPIRLLHFGGNHPTHLIPWLFHCLARLKESGQWPQVELVMAGMSETSKLQLLKELGLEHLGSRINATGFLPEAEVSRQLTEATLVLAPFWDGVSTRRSTFMAAISHGCAVATTIGTSTDSLVDWNSFAFTVPAPSSPDDVIARERYIQLVQDTLANGELLTQIGKAAQLTYLRNFSWNRIGIDLGERMRQVIGL